MERSIYEVLGGAEALLALAEAWHRRCLADPILAHPFEGGVHPHHTERLAAYWSEQLGGPAAYTESIDDYSNVVRVHTRTVRATRHPVLEDQRGEHDER